MAFLDVDKRPNTASIPAGGSEIQLQVLNLCLEQLPGHNLEEKTLRVRCKSNMGSFV